MQGCHKNELSARKPWCNQHLPDSSCTSTLIVLDSSRSTHPYCQEKSIPRGKKQIQGTNPSVSMSLSISPQISHSHLPDCLSHPNKGLQAPLCRFGHGMLMAICERLFSAQKREQRGTQQTLEGREPPLCASPAKQKQAAGDPSVSGFSPPGVPTGALSVPGEKRNKQKRIKQFSTVFCKVSFH